MYVLFIFVSVHVSNPMPNRGVRGMLFFVVLLVVWALLTGSAVECDGVPEASHYLCSYFEGFSYCLFCLILMLGFVGVSVVSREKDSFFR